MVYGSVPHPDLLAADLAKQTDAQWEELRARWAASRDCQLQYITRPSLLNRGLDHGLGLAEIRRRVGQAAAGATRVLKPEAERQPVVRQWTMTIADVYCLIGLMVPPGGYVPERLSSSVL